MGIRPQSFGSYLLDEEGKLEPEPRKGTEPFVQAAKNRDLSTDLIA